MKTSLMLMALLLASTSAFAEGPKLDKSKLSNQVSSEINRLFGIESSENFEFKKEGKTAFGKDCIVEVEQSLNEDGGVNHYYVNTQVRNADPTSIFQFNYSLVKVNKSERGNSQNLEKFSVGENNVEVKIVEKKCHGGFPMRFCDEAIDTLKIVSKKGKIQVEVGASVEGIKGLWLSEKVSCIINDEN